jgi:CRP/FNR family transcriptional regulator
MISQTEFERVAAAFPMLRQAEAPLAREFQRTVALAALPAGKDVFVEGDRALSLALLLSGSVRVYKIGKTGREITLYRFGLGESCILTANAILSQQPFPALATVEQAAEAVIVPAAAFRAWVGQSETWREFVFQLLSLRLMSVLTLVDDVVFRRMDARVAALLQERSVTSNPVPVTHQELAAELGSSREVVSRILEGMVAAGTIRTGRGAVEVLDAPALAALASM